MFCKNCGTQIDDNSVFCSRCGTQVSQGGRGVSPITETIFDPTVIISSR